MFFRQVVRVGNFFKLDDVGDVDFYLLFLSYILQKIVFCEILKLILRDVWLIMFGRILYR